MGNFEVEGLDEEAAEAAAAEANPRSESTSDPALPPPSFPAGLFEGLLAASKAASAAAGGGQAKAEKEGGSSITGGLESPGGATDDPEADLKFGLASLELPPPAAARFTFIRVAAACLSTIALKFMALEADSM